MQRGWLMVLAACGLGALQSGCAFEHPFEVKRCWIDWNTEREVSFQVEKYSHLPLKPVRVRMTDWAYNPGRPGTPVPPRGGAPETTVVPADALPPVAPPEPTYIPETNRTPQSGPPTESDLLPLPPPVNPPPPTTGAQRDLLDRAQPPAPKAAPAGTGPTAQRPLGVLPASYQYPSEPPLVVPPSRVTPAQTRQAQARSAAWLFDSPNRKY